MKRLAFIILISLWTYVIGGNVIVMPFRNIKTNEPDIEGVHLKYYVESLLEKSDSKLDKDFLVGFRSSFNDIDPEPAQYVITGSYLKDKGKWFVYLKISNTKTCTGQTYYFEGNSFEEVKSKMREQFTNCSSVKKIVKEKLNNIVINGSEENVRQFKEFMLSIPKDQYDWEMYFLLGEAHRFLGEYEDAETCYGKALKLTEDDYQKIAVWISIGIMNRQTGQYDKALEIYDLALSKCSDDTQKCVLLNNKANVLYSIGKKEEAIKLWREALKYANPEMREAILINLEGSKYETGQDYNSQDIRY
jgi:tetratricopeptide (TPR) repeat protein